MNGTPQHFNTSRSTMNEEATCLWQLKIQNVWVIQRFDVVLDRQKSNCQFPITNLKLISNYQLLSYDYF